MACRSWNELLEQKVMDWRLPGRRGGRHLQAPPGRFAPGSGTRDAHRDIPAFVSPETFSKSEA